jgi:hypothetical protein
VKRKGHLTDAMAGALIALLLIFTVVFVAKIVGWF